MINTTPRTVVVTGAAGFIGSHTVDRLLSEGHRVLGIDDLSTGSPTNLTRALNDENFELVIQDILNPGFLNSYCSRHQPDVIIHLAGLVNVSRAEADPRLNCRLNVRATQVVADAAQRAEIPRIVFGSSAAIYGESSLLPMRESEFSEPLGNYGNATLISELLLKQYARSYGMTAICNRYFNVFGPRQSPAAQQCGVVAHFVDRYAAGLPVTIFGDGTQTRDFISVHDVAEANVIAATAPEVQTGSYNICTGRAHSLIELISILEQEYPQPRVPRFSEERLGDIKHSLGSPERTRLMLGFSAGISFREAIAELTACSGVASPRAV